MRLEPNIWSNTLSRLFVFLTLMVMSLGLEMAAADSKIIHIERSLYRDVYVYDLGNQLCTGFMDRNDQSCIYKDAKDYLVWEYYRASIAGLLIAGEPKKILMIGLGGGVLANAIHSLFPDVELEVVELDSAMLKVAKDYFDFEESEQVRVVINDGRVRVKRALLAEERFDAVILDAFELENTPEHMLTAEFLKEVRAILEPSGVFIAHTKADNQLRDALLRTYHEVFGDYYSLDPRGCCRLIFAEPQSLTDKAVLGQRAIDQLENMQRLHVSVEDILHQLSVQSDWDPDAVVLTDSYFPGNLLNANP